ncbi:MAG TPA: hypothetical protein PLQ44_02150 [Candidatus Paceibacterota bacterium]|jgi:hypothetical protein|nr:hypothetical protein [Candidatus Paceibacterota bacterium]HPT40381.1 hypothetical protein [Candidatus Paceibacterota bacterium]
MWEDNTTTQSIFRIVLALFVAVFLCTVFFDVYLLSVSQKMVEQAKTMKKEMEVGKVLVDFGNGTKRAFEGEVSNTGLSLYEVLMTVGATGEIEIKFTNSSANTMILESIGDNLNNKDGHGWLVVLPELGWSKPINEIDLDNIILVGGGTTKLVYR